MTVETVSLMQDVRDLQAFHHRQEIAHLVLFAALMAHVALRIRLCLRRKTRRAEGEE
jgi:hypothetical protein